MTSAILVGVSTFTHIQAQTQYGVGAGMTGPGRAFFGTDAGKVNGNFGTNNSFFGHQAGANNNGAQNGTFIGYQAGFNNDAGGVNTFVGSFAGHKNKDGTVNTYLGGNSGHNTISGDANVFVGVNAGFYNENGSGNVAVGFQAHSEAFNSTGNCAVGAQAAFKGGGNYNVAVGNEAGFNNATGFENIFLGYKAGYSTGSGELNTFLGARSGHENTTGHHNAFLGEKAGYSNKEGFFNTFLGAESGYSSQTGVANVFLGNKSGYSNTNGHNNVFLGYGTGYHNTTGERNTYVGYGAGGDPTLFNATALGSEATVTSSNSIVLGNKANVGIGISAPAFQLHLSTDDAAKLGSPSWIVASDKRLKQDISDFTDGLSVLKQIHPIWFRYNGNAGTSSDKKFVGIIAQEMQKIAPYTVGTFQYQDSLGNKTEYLDYDANAVTYILINSVKEQQQTIEEKDAELKQMSEQLASLSKRLEELERTIASGNTKPLNGSAARTEPNGVVLEQNFPNGFSGSSYISYFIPQSIRKATVDVYSVNGIKINSYLVKERGEGRLTISAGDFQNGVFLYDLVTDGKSNGVKKMVVQK